MSSNVTINGGVVLGGVVLADNIIDSFNGGDNSSSQSTPPTIAMAPIKRVTKQLSFDSSLTNVLVVGAMTVRITFEETPSCTVSAPSDVIDFVTADERAITDGETMLVLNSNKDALAVNIELVLPKIECIAMVGDGSVNVVNAISDDFGIVLSGSGDIDAVVTCKNCTIKHEGTGRIMADVDTDSVEVEADGTGCVKLVGKTNTLEATVKGHATLEAKALLSRVTKVESFTSTLVRIHTTEEVNAAQHGAGSLLIYGQPLKQNMQRTGQGTIINY